VTLGLTSSGAEPATLCLAPGWKPGQRADWELRVLREDLERKLVVLPEDDIRVVRYRAELDDVVAEQQGREAGRRRRRGPDR
jgi:hypothetical protein